MEANTNAWSGLQHWPEDAAKALNALIRRHAHQGAYAVFDADNTTYRHDLVGALLPYLEMRGVLTRAAWQARHPHLVLIPFKDTPGFTESLNSYYRRLCDIDDQVSYPWASQVFAGFTLGALKGYMDDMLACTEPVPDVRWVGDQVVTQQAKIPRMLQGQQALFAALMAHGIEVYVVSAASEELVRMIVADPRYGYHVKPENVIGVSLLLRDPATHDITVARKLIANKQYNPGAMAHFELTTALWAPLPWYEGKHAAIQTHIHPLQRPVLVAGDTPQSDGPMLLRGPDVTQGGLRLFVCRKESARQGLAALQADHAAHQRDQQLPVTAHDNWLVVAPDEIA